MALSDSQKLITRLLESQINDEIDAIGTPELDNDGNVLVSFQYGGNVFDAVIDPDAGTVQY